MECGGGGDSLFGRRGFTTGTGMEDRTVGIGSAE